MTRIDRYLLREIAVPLGFSLGFVVLAVFLLQGQRLLTAALGLGLTPWDLVLIFVSALPPFAVLAVPIACLLSVLVGLGRLAQDRELVALRAAGVGPLRLARAPLVLGALVGAIALPIAHLGEPYGLRLLYLRLVDVGLRNISYGLQPGVFNEDFQGLALYAREREPDGALLGLVVYDERVDGRPMLVLATRGRLEPDGQSGLALRLEDGELHVGAASTPTRYERVEFQRLELGIDARRELLDRTRFVSEIAQLTTPEMWRGYHARLGSNWARRVERAFWRRFSFPLMCPIFALVACAIVLAARAEARAESAILALLAVVGYYVLMRVTDTVALDHDLGPALAAWGPNLTLLVLGVVGLARAGRGSVGPRGVGLVARVRARFGGEAR
jgi:lipopolysaccharide export system permease protein